jgi:DNA-binding YbaB/EbfC family protein
MGKFKPRASSLSKTSAGGGNLGQQLQKLQDEMKKAQEQLAEETLTVSAGGGLIEVEITGHQRVRAIRIKPEAIDPSDPTLLEDLVTAAVNEAIERSQAMAADRMQGLSGGLGGLGLPGM